ncbi:MAG: flagellar hook-length control protein FliK, partial [Lachnospiraceae bacterium]|nr:flagellar hook-length control protein FliK [Lachnospiraceae bacterium]MDE6254357.1 flagellar hook-length control protein FliK [Lachnospiraceae bacterium]
MMNINLGSLFINNEGSNMMQQIQQTDNGEIKEALLNGKIADIKSLLPGMLFEGDVADIKNLQVKIILDNNSVLNASMKEAVNLNIGEHVIFQVKENSGSKLVIKPFQSDEGSAVITKALNTSGITINEKNVAVVKELMAQGQPLDKNTIMDTVRLFNKFPEAELTDIIELKKHDIPVTSDNIAMYKAYSEGNANISENLANVADDVPKVIENILSESDNSQTMNVVSDILDIIMPEESSDAINPYDNMVAVNESENVQVSGDIKTGQELQENEKFQPVSKEHSEVQMRETVQNYSKTYEPKVQEQQYSDKIHEAVVSEDGKVIKSVISKESTEQQQSIKIFEPQEKQVQEYDKSMQIPMETFTKVLKEMPSEMSKEMPSEMLKEMSSEMSKEMPSEVSEEIPGKVLSEISKEAPVQVPVTNEDKLASAIKFFENIAEKVEKDKNVDMKSVKQHILKIFEESEPEQRKVMAESEPFKKLVHNAIKKNMFIKPDIIRESDNPKEEIGKLYEKVKVQLEKLSESVKDAVTKGMLNEKQSSTLLNNIKTTNQNLNFMNELNHMASYIQIPVKFTGQEATGELYVYNRNVKKTVEEGISAFLHFDLENLGVTDIRINLKDKGLRIGFELGDEISVKLVEKHIDELLSRLKEKGYSVNCSVEHKDKTDNNSLEKIFEQDKKQVSIKRYTFDIRT